MNSSGKFFVPSTIVGFLVAFAAPADPVLTIPMRSATPNETANAAFAARRVCLRNIPSSSRVRTAPETLRGGRHPAEGRALQQGERAGDEQREGRDAVRGPEHARVAVA